MAREMEYGDKGDDVRELQEKLHSLGYAEVGTPDGEFFQHTQAAVRRFQTDHGLDPSGRADEATLWAVEAAKTESMNRATQRPDSEQGGDPAGTTDQSGQPQDAGGGASGPRQAIVDAGGNVLLDAVKANFVHLTGDLSELEWYAREAAEVAFPWLKVATSEAASLNATIAVGLDADLAAIIGAGAGAGLYFGTNGDWGVYLTAGMDFGIVATASIGIAAMVIDGPPSRLAGDAWAVEASLDIGFGFGGAVMFDSKGDYLGVAVEASLGFGGGVYGSFSNTKLVQIN